MDGISSTPMENSVQFLRLRDKYNWDVLDDSHLTKAAGLAAQQELLLESQAPDTWKEPRFKSLNRQLRQCTKKIRHPGGTRTARHDDTDDEDEYNLAVGPMKQFVGHITKIQKGIKKDAAVSKIPQTPTTPALNQSPGKPLSSKKPKYSEDSAKKTTFC